MYFVSIIYNQYQASATHCYLRIFYERIHASSLLRGVRPLFLLAMTCNDISIFQGILTLCLEVREAAIKKRVNYIAK